MQPPDSFRIRKIVIEYSTDRPKKLYRMTLPAKTKVDAIILDWRLKVLLEAAQKMVATDPDAVGLIADKLNDPDLEADLRAAMDSYEPRAPSGPDAGDGDELPTRFKADGTDWGEWMAPYVESLERSDAAWLPEHCRTDLCIHDEDCMWFCME